MQYLLVILALATCFALVRTFKIKGSKGSLWITIIAMVAAILSVIPFAPLAYDGFILYAICVVVSFFVVESKDDVGKEDKTLLYLFIGLTSLTAVPELIPTVIPGNVSALLGLLGFVPPFLFIYMAFYKWNTYKNEFGYLAIFAAFAVIRAIYGLLIILNPLA